MGKKKTIQIAFGILMVESVLALIYGLSAFILPEFITSKTFPLYTGQSWNMLLDHSPEIANYILILEGAAGGLGFTTVLGNLFVLLTAFRKGERWAWFFILVVSIAGWGIILITNILMKNSLSIIIIGTGLLLLILALIISAKAFLAEKINE